MTTSHHSHTGAGGAGQSACAANLILWAEEVRNDPNADPATLRRACRTLMLHSPDAGQRARAEDLLCLLDGELNVETPTDPQAKDALQLAIGVLYDDLTSCIECSMTRHDDGTPKPGSMDADARRWFAQVIAAVHAVEAVIGRHIGAANPRWLADIIDGRIAP